MTCIDQHTDAPGGVVRLSVSLAPSVAQALRSLSERFGVTLTEGTRRSIRAWHDEVARADRTNSPEAVLEAREHAAHLNDHRGDIELMTEERHILALDDEVTRLAAVASAVEKLAEQGQSVSADDLRAALGGLS